MPRKPAMKQFNLLIPKAIFYRIRDHCRPRGLSIASFCREAITDKVNTLAVTTVNHNDEGRKNDGDEEN